MYSVDENKKKLGAIYTNTDYKFNSLNSLVYVCLEEIIAEHDNSFRIAPLTITQACNVGNYFLHKIFIENKIVHKKNCF